MAATGRSFHRQRPPRMMAAADCRHPMPAPQQHRQRFRGRFTPIPARGFTRNCGRWQWFPEWLGIARSWGGNSSPETCPQPGGSMGNLFRGDWFGQWTRKEALTSTCRDCVAEVPIAARRSRSTVGPSQFQTNSATSQVRRWSSKATAIGWRRRFLNPRLGRSVWRGPQPVQVHGVARRFTNRSRNPELIDLASDGYF